MASTPHIDHLSGGRVRAAALVVLAAALALPAAASADSIVYIDQGNVVSARPDGSGRVQLTDGGGWHSPTQADDGTIAAVQGTGPIVVMAPDGRPLRTIATPEARSGDGGTFAPRPVQLSFSPDGSKIAYAYVASSCPPGSTCGTIQRSVFYTRADVTEATPHSVWGNQFSVSNPEWVTNDRTLVFGGGGRQVAIDDLGPGDDSTVPWLTPGFDMGDGEASRDGRRLVTTVEYGANLRLAFYVVEGDLRTQVPPDPEIACSSSAPDERFNDPSWSPDGSAVAFGSSKGVEVLRFTAFAPQACQTAGSSTVLAPGAESPDWGPADPPAARWTPPAQQPGPAPGPDPRTPGTPRAPTSPRGGGRAVALRLAAPPRLSVAALRAGATVRVRTSAAGRVAVTLKRGRRTVARGAARARRAGTVAVRLPRLSTRAARGLRGAKLTLVVSGTARGLRAGRTTVTARVR